jgi:hypothetical protein
MELGDIGELRNELLRRLDSVDDWLKNEPSLKVFDVATGEADSEVLDRKWLTTARDTIQKLKVRTASSLINVAFVGGYSSGKSFLISGLQNRLDYEQVPGDDPLEIASNRYIGLLYSAPQATTACPAAIVPVGASDEYDASDRGFLRVRFTDRPYDWEEIENSPPAAVVAAYTTQNDEIIINRLTPDHRQRKVAEVEILLEESELPAKLYDLPGHGSLEPIHDEISNRAWADADCIVFTTQATASLGMADDELISRLYSHYLGTGKKIIWVVTGIDRANEARNLSDKKRAWKEAIDVNDTYLQSRYPAFFEQPGTLLKSNGFIGVSPAAVDLAEPAAAFHEPDVSGTVTGLSSADQPGPCNLGLLQDHLRQLVRNLPDIDLVWDITWEDLVQQHEQQRGRRERYGRDPGPAHPAAERRVPMRAERADGNDESHRHHDQRD